MLSFLLAITGLTVIGAPVAKAAVSPLITSYKPKVVNADFNASYTDGNGNTITATIRHPGIAMTQADLDNMRDHARAWDEPWNTAWQTSLRQAKRPESIMRTTISSSIFKVPEALPIPIMACTTAIPAIMWGHARIRMH
jgi:hypothetical protein